ncbi:MAG TPA: hypothetical protein VFE40_08920 [Jatrophihabitantaceae bacterium]|nr:hypothetical protein [Jatrophihabitantaceae bacterium]
MHTCFRATDAYPQVDDAVIDLDLDGPRATLIASGRLGPRSAGVLRTMLDALDAVPSPIHVKADGVREVADEFVSALCEAQVRRHHLELPGLVLDDADGNRGAAVLSAAVPSILPA